MGALVGGRGEARGRFAGDSHGGRVAGRWGQRAAVTVGAHWGEAQVSRRRAVGGFRQAEGANKKGGRLGIGRKSSTIGEALEAKAKMYAAVDFGLILGPVASVAEGTL